MASKEEFDQQAALQREFAKNSIRWKVEDAKAAGLHPLAAIGASGYSASPIYTGDNNTSQPTARAGFSTGNRPARNKELEALTLEHQRLQNEFLSSKITLLNQPGTPPAAPPPSGMSNILTGQGNANPTPDTALVVQQPAVRTYSQPGRPQQEVGAIPDYGYVKTKSGYAVVPGKDVKERIEDQIVPETMWAVRNQMAPALSGLTPPDPKYFPVPGGYTRWVWNPYKQQFVPGGRRNRPNKNRLYWSPRKRR